MKGHFYRRGCTFKKKNCTCRSKSAYVVDIGVDPITGKRKQKTKSGFNTKKEAETGLAHVFLMFLILSYTGIRVGELVALKNRGIKGHSAGPHEDAGFAYSQNRKV